MPKRTFGRRYFLRTASAAVTAASLAPRHALGAAETDGGASVYNIAMISTSHVHTRSFLNNLDEREDRRTAYIWDDNHDRGQRFAEEFGVPFEPDLEAIVNDDGVDGFVICSENTTHLSLLEEIMPTGKPVFCDKPLVTTTEALARVRDLREAHGNPLFAGYFHPFTAEMQGVKSVLEDGVLGDITRIRDRYAHHAAYGGWFDSDDVAWFTDPELAGGGAFLDLGTHAVHLVLTLFGPIEEVFAEIRNESGIYPEVDDAGIAQLRFASGILGTVESAWTQTGGLAGLEVVGSERTLWRERGGYRHAGPGQSEEAVEPGAEVPHQVDRLIAILKDEISQHELERDLEATEDAVKVIEAAYRSSESGTWEPVG